jgi:hypothetical protein
MYEIVKAIEDQWREDGPRTELWLYWRIAHRRNSSQVHGGASPYADAAQHLFEEGFSENPRLLRRRVCRRTLFSALWVYGQFFGLIFDHIDDAKRAEFDDLWVRVHALSVGVAGRPDGG